MAGGAWPVWKIAVLVYPLAAGAAAVNVFFIGLMIQVFGVTAFSPMASVWMGIVLGVPFGLVAARQIRKMIDEAEN